jgi:type III pantothenate kinase
MLLVIDIGNTHVSLGVYSRSNESELLGHWRISSGRNRTDDETWLMLNMLLKTQNLQLANITGCAISSVVPDQTPVFVRMLQQQLKIVPMVVTAQIETGLKILYHDPDSVGPDRICNSIAGLKKHRGPLIIVDFGTATTFDVVSANSEYLGGVIAPGVESSSYVLHQYAARLPKVELRFPDRVIGKTTEASMQSGIMFGSVELVNGIIRRINGERGYDCKIIVTGGIGTQLFEKLSGKPRLEPFLTLEGLRIIYDKHIDRFSATNE